MPTIAGYELGRLLGQGAFGQTYEATKDGNRYALKLIKADAILRGFDARRFEREVRALRKITGDNVVRFIDAGTDKLGTETRYFVVLEYLEGWDLAAMMQKDPNGPTANLIKDILCQTVNGLETIHRENIIHRDLKPANIFFTVDGRIKILDFGLVRMIDYTTLTTAPGQAIGTPMFIAPEILRGEEIDYRADFYSLGVLAYWLTTEGKHPFEARLPLELYGKVVNTPPTPPTRHNRELSSNFENLILTLLKKHPYERPASHAVLRHDLETTSVHVNRVSVPTPERSEASRHPKRCYFRLLQREKSAFERFIHEGGSADGVEFQANYLPRSRATLASLRSMGVPFYFDPVTYRLQYSSFSQTEGLVNLPYVDSPPEILTARKLGTLDAQQAYARKVLDWQLQWGVSFFVSPFHFARDMSSDWIDIDIKLLEESLEYRNSISPSLEVVAGLCINIESYTDPANQVALLNRYSRAAADRYLFMVDGIDERGSNQIQIRALVDLLLRFKELGKPVIASRSGTLGLGLLAAGVDGVTMGIAKLTGFSENHLLENRSFGYDIPARYYIPGLLLALPVELAEDILSDERNADLLCLCPHCKGSSRNLSRYAQPHFLRRRTEEIQALNALPSTAARLDWLYNQVESARAICERIRKQGFVKFDQRTYAHLKVWHQAFFPSVQ